MSDHGWKSMLARISRWLAAPVRVDFNPRAGLGFGGRTITIAPIPVEEPEPPRRERIHFSAPVSQPAVDRLRAREAEYEQLQSEISHLTQRNDDAPAANG
jgi:hypothetical protein